MKKLSVTGGIKLNGTVEISGSKNTSLPILFSTMLFENDVILNNVPEVSDIKITIKLLQDLGVEVQKLDENCYRFNAKNIQSYTTPYEIVKQMRASFYALGSLLGRLGKAKVSLPGGCAIGTRPVDIHLSAFEQMGATIENDAGYINASVKDKLNGADITFRKVSVGATLNVIMGAVLANGKTIIRNVAKEPDVIDFVNFLNKAGAKITGVGTNIIEIEGVKKLKSVEHDIIGDRIEAGTYMIASIITDGDLTLTGLDFKEDLGSLIDVLQYIGADIKYVSENSIRIKRGNNQLRTTNIITYPFPGFPTDLQPQIMALLANIDGISIIDETIFENRFMHVAELNRMGANISIIQNNRAHINGKKNCYTAANVMASDLRAGAALMLAGLAANGTTTIDRYYHMERGYENIVKKLSNCGAKIEIINDNIEE